MDGNKDEALRCVSIAGEAIASGNKERALKFIKMAQRLNHNLSVNDLLAACDKLDSRSVDGNCVVNDDVGGGGGGGVDKNKNNNKSGQMRNDEGLNDGRSNSEEHVQLIRQIKRSNDYYAILGLEKTCSVEEIRRAYKKLSLKVHPDKNKAPGSDEAFKKLSKAFKCLSNGDSRRQYDRTALVEEFEHNQQYNVKRRRRRTADNFCDDDFDPDEIFRSFFGQTEMFRTHHVHMSRGTGREEFHGGGGGPNLILLLQILPILLIFLLAYLPFSEPDYSLHKNYSYQVPKSTEKYGVEFFVKSSNFDENFPIGSPARAKIEGSVINDYRNMLWRYCHIELQRRHWSKNMPTPNCAKLESLGLG